MITEKLKKLLDNYNKGLSLYREKKFKEAVTSFKKGLEAKPDDGPCQIYIERCEMFIKTPPDVNWDGVFTMTTK